jgi:hypothetical protein
MNPFILCPGGPNGSSAAQIELKEQIWIWRDVRHVLCVARVLGQDGRRWRGGLRRGKVHLRCPFQGARRALADAPGPQILLTAGGQLLDLAELLRRLRWQQGLRPSARKARRWCRCALRGSQRKAHGQVRSNMPGSGALAAAAGPKGKGSRGAMQGRPLRCQHGRRWSQSGRGWQGYMLRHLRDC